MRYEFYTNETIDLSGKVQYSYFPALHGYRAGAHMKLAHSALYSGPFPADTTPEADENPVHQAVLERLFYVFNMDVPPNYEGAPLGVGDVVVIIDNGNRFAYSCEMAGW